MKKVLLLDTNVSSKPIYDYLVNRGFDVYVAGSNENDCLAKDTDKYIQFDYSNQESLKEIIMSFNFDYLIPGCNDVSYQSAAKVNGGKNGLDSAKVAGLINNKFEFRMYSLSNNITVPKIYKKEDILLTKNKLIVKPVDAYSGRGISLIQNGDNLQEVENAIDNACKFSKTKAYIIEDFIDGQLYSHSAFIRNKKIILDFFVIEDGSTNKFTVDTSYVVNDLPKLLKRKIRKEIESLSNGLDLVDGLVHTQFIKYGDSFKIIEITRRCPGDLYSLLIKKTTGHNYIEYYVQPFLGEDIVLSNKQNKSKYILRHTITTSNQRKIFGLEFKKTLKIDDFIPFLKTGEYLKESPFGRFGIIFIECKSKSDLYEKYAELLERRLYSFT